MDRDDLTRQPADRPDRKIEVVRRDGLDYRRQPSGKGTRGWFRADLIGPAKSIDDE